MKGIWKTEDCVAGQAVSHQANDGTWFAPQIIGWIQQQEGPNLPTLVDITDGMVTPFKSDFALAEHLTKHGYMPCVKVIARHDDLRYPENRMDMPILAALNCKGS